MTRTSNKTVVAVLLYLALALATQTFFQQYGARYLDSALLKATASFALARGLNGVITVVQESSVSAGVIVEGSVAVGQILDPVNDLVEGFSWIMLASIISLGVQKLLLVVGAQAGFVLFGAALAALLVHWAVNRRVVGETVLSYRLLVLAIVVQSAVPLTSSVGAAVSSSFLAQRYQEAESAITAVQQDLQSEFGFTDTPRRLFERLDPRNLVQTVTQKAAEVTGHVVDLMIIFVFETVVMPLLTLLVVLLVLGALLRTGSEPAPAALPAA